MLLSAFRPPARPRPRTSRTWPANEQTSCALSQGEAGKGIAPAAVMALAPTPDAHPTPRPQTPAGTSALSKARPTGTAAPPAVTYGGHRHSPHTHPRWDPRPFLVPHPPPHRDPVPIRTPVPSHEHTPLLVSDFPRRPSSLVRQPRYSANRLHILGLTLRFYPARHRGPPGAGPGGPSPGTLCSACRPQPPAPKRKA